MNSHMLTSLKGCLAPLFNKDKDLQKKYCRGRNPVVVCVFNGEYF